MDRLWLKDISKEQAPVDLWQKAVAPSKELRQWFNYEAITFVYRAKDDKYNHLVVLKELLEKPNE